MRKNLTFWNIINIFVLYQLKLLGGSNMNNEATAVRRPINCKLPVTFIVTPKKNRIWGENYIVLCDRKFTNLQYNMMIETLIMDRATYGLNMIM
jgi:hypothetical protein